MKQTDKSEAQATGARSLDELKQETVLRADRKVYPMTGVSADDTREAMAQLQNLTPDAWANAWISVAEKHEAHARTLDADASPQAPAAWRRAWQGYYMARWPTDNSPRKQYAYRRSLEMFAAYTQRLAPPIETVRIPFEGSAIVAYLRLPASGGPAPLVLGISGLDSRKEDMIEQLWDLPTSGVGALAVDMPGTGEAPLKADVGAERMYSCVLDYLATRSDVDATRIVVRGQSGSGHWSAVLAHTERARIRGAVYHSGPIHHAFQPDWQRKALASREYLFGLYEARAGIYGTKTLDEFLAYGPRLSLVARGLIGQPTAPMLLLGGCKDTQVPIEDLYLLLNSGTPKEAWVNPDGGHMGRSERWPQPLIIQRIVTPWILRALNGEVPPAAAV